MTLINGSSHADLLAENARLRAQLKAANERRSPISIDPSQGEITVDNLTLGGLSVESLRVRSPGLRGATVHLQDIGNWSPTKLQTGALGELTKKPLVIDELKARVPLPVVNSLLENVAGHQMAKAGLSEINLSQGSGNQLKVTGRLKKGISLPFEASGELGTTADGKVKFSLKSSRLGGIPMPNSLVGLASNLAGASLAKAGVSVDGENFTIDTSRQKPDNLIFQLDQVALVDGALTVQGSAPTRKAKSSIPSVPRRV